MLNIEAMTGPDRFGFPLLPRPLAPPAAATPRAPELRVSSEREAGIASGTVQRLRGVSKDWLKEDPNGFVVLLARRGVVFMHEGFGGFEKNEGFRPASIGKADRGAHLRARRRSGPG
jgi:hypothetical protein